METVQVKERPILFSGAMVRALLAGSKTQTRRAIKGIEITDGNVPGSFHYEVSKAKEGFDAGRNMTLADLNTRLLGIIGHCPYGQPGDRLWVREAFGYNHAAAEAKDVLVYRADYNESQLVTWPRREQKRSYQQAGQKMEYTEDANHWYSSIHMPRAASRLLLEIIAVRVERVQDISEADAKAEGVDMRVHAYYETGSLTMIYDHNRGVEAFAKVIGARAQYAWLWNEINGPRAWEGNPWV